MTQRMLSIHAYDCLDHVRYSAQIREYEGYESDEHTVVAELRGDLQGRGHEFWPHWLADILSDMLEQM